MFWGEWVDIALVVPLLSDVSWVCSKTKGDTLRRIFFISRIRTGGLIYKSRECVSGYHHLWGTSENRFSGVIVSARGWMCSEFSMLVGAWNEEWHVLFWISVNMLEWTVVTRCSLLRTLYDRLLPLYFHLGLEDHYETLVLYVFHLFCQFIILHCLLWLILQWHSTGKIPDAVFFLSFVHVLPGWIHLLFTTFHRYLWSTLKHH
jgi:hypothetical protein